jgi:hypothetical protein
MIFLSHSTQDKPLVRFISGELRACGLGFWLDEKRLLPGDALQPTIERAIEQSSFMIAFLSKASIKSRWVQIEIEAVRRRPAEAGGRFVPCLIGDIEWADLPHDISALLCAALRDPTAYSAQMGRLLRKLSAGRAPSRLPALTAHRSADLVRRASQDAEVSRQVVDWLKAFVADADDQTERYWAYLTIGRLGSPSLREFLAVAIATELGFARGGAVEALQALTPTDGAAPG